MGPNNGVGHGSDVVLVDAVSTISFNGPGTTALSPTPTALYNLYVATQRNSLCVPLAPCFVSWFGSN